MQIEVAQNSHWFEETAISLINIDVMILGTEELFEVVSTLNDEKRVALSNACHRLVEGETNRRVPSLESRRIWSKLIACEYPGSKPLIESALFTYSDKYARELQFTLFCFLDDVAYLPLTKKEDLMSIVELVFRYLMTVNSETAFAAWMAGNMLGDHLDLELSLTFLLDAALNARFVPGRLSAIDGLAHALSRTSAAEAAKIKLLMRRIAQSDRSQQVRETARSVLKGKTYSQL